MVSVRQKQGQKSSPYGFELRRIEAKKGVLTSVNTWGQKLPLFASPQYATVLEPGQNIKSNWGQKPLLH